MQFGAKKSKFDIRDYRIKKSVTQGADIPTEFSWDFNVPVKNQGLVSSCVAHALASILEFHAPHDRELSTNFIYGIQKQLCGHSGEGMYLRDACKIAATYGDMLESDCPGNTEVPKCHSVAEESLLDDIKVDMAVKHRIENYILCVGDDEIKYAIYKYGPVLANMKWYDTYYAGLDGVLRGKRKGSVGYHAIVVYGYDANGYWCQNSWGKLWGKSGKFYVPNEYGLNEVRALVDYENDDELILPKEQTFIDILYKVFNSIVNFFINIFKKKS